MNPPARPHGPPRIGQTSWNPPGSGHPWGRQAMEDARLPAGHGRQPHDRAPGAGPDERGTPVVGAATGNPMVGADAGEPHDHRPGRQPHDHPPAGNPMVDADAGNPMSGAGSGGPISAACRRPHGGGPGGGPHGGRHPMRGRLPGEPYGWGGPHAGRRFGGPHARHPHAIGRGSEPHARGRGAGSPAHTSPGPPGARKPGVLGVPARWPPRHPVAYAERPAGQRLQREHDIDHGTAVHPRCGSLRGKH